MDQALLLIYKVLSYYDESLVLEFDSAGRRIKFLVIFVINYRIMGAEMAFWSCEFLLIFAFSKIKII